jgi:hypothetical protein
MRRNGKPGTKYGLLQKCCIKTVIYFWVKKSFKRSPPQSGGPADFSLKKIYQTTQHIEGNALHIPEKQ